MSQGKDTSVPNREGRIKSFLDACAYLILRDNAEDTLSHYKEMTRGKAEIPVSSCPPSIAHMIDGSQFSPVDENVERERFELMMYCLLGSDKTNAVAKKNKSDRIKTRSQRIERARQEHPGCTFDFCPVDTENEFTHNGVRYRIDSSLDDYNPIETKHGLWYGSDQIVIITDPDGSRFFYTQQIHPIDKNLIVEQ